MLQEIIEPLWIDAFETVLRRCALQPGDTVAVLCESQSRPVLVQLAQLAAARVGAASFTVTLPSVANPRQPVTRHRAGRNRHGATSPALWPAAHGS